MCNEETKPRFSNDLCKDMSTWDKKRKLAELTKSFVKMYDIIANEKNKDEDSTTILSSFIIWVNDLEDEND